MSDTNGANLIDLQIMWNRLIAVVEEQAQVLLRTAFSPIVRECGDLSAGVFDAKGRMLAQAVTGTPGHVNSMANAVKHFLEAYPLAQMRPGDHYITNDPWLTCGHLHDLTVVSPTFLDGRPVNKPEVMIGQAQNRFVDGKLTDEASGKLLGDLGASLLLAIRHAKAAAQHVK